MIDKYLAYLYEQKEKGIITDAEYNVKVENMVEYKLFIQGHRQEKRGDLWVIGEIDELECPECGIFKGIKGRG